MTHCYFRLVASRWDYHRMSGLKQQDKDFKRLNMTALGQKATTAHVRNSLLTNSSPSNRDNTSSVKKQTSGWDIHHRIEFDHRHAMEEHSELPHLNNWEHHSSIRMDCLWDRELQSKLCLATSTVKLLASNIRQGKQNLITWMMSIERGYSILQGLTLERQLWQIHMWINQRLQSD